MKESGYLDYIKHPAVVKNVDKENETVTVVISEEGECGSCPAVKLCSISSKNGADKNTLKISTPYASGFSVGETVNIIGTESMHKKAIVIAMVVPCLVLVLVMVSCYIYSGQQALSALMGLCSVIVVFFVFYLLRNKFEHQFSFTLEKLS